MGKSLSDHVLGYEDEAYSWHATENEVFDAEGNLDTRQSFFTRRFIHAPLEKAFVRRTFPHGRAWVRLLLCSGLVYETGLLMHALACQCGLRWELAGHWYMRIFTMGSPLPVTALGLAFTYSRRCTPRTLAHATIWGSVLLTLGVLLPNAIASGELRQDIVVLEGGHVHTEMGILLSYKNLLIQYAVLEFVLSFCGTVIAHAGGVSPPAIIMLNAVCLTLHASLADPAFSARFSPELSVAGTWWHPTLSVFCCTVVLAYALSALRRRVFLVQLLTAAKRIEQLSREKERAEWQRALAAMKPREYTVQGTEMSERGPAGTAHGGVPIRIDEVRPTSLVVTVESAASSPRALQRRSSSSSDPSNETDGEVVDHFRDAASRLDDPEAGAPSSASPKSSGSLGLDALRHELRAARGEIQARKATTRTLANTGVTTGASVVDAPSIVSPPSEATSATAADLHRAFETEPQERSGTIAAISRPKKGREHPLRAFVLALYGQRPPGPMPGQMPGDVELNDTP